MAATSGTQWGQSMTANDIYTVAGSSSGSSGHSGNGGAATSAKLYGPDGVAFDASGDLYVADDLNNRIQEVAAAGGHPVGPVDDRQRHLHRGRELVRDLGRQR